MKKIRILIFTTVLSIAAFSFLKPNNPQIQITNRLGETTEHLLQSVNNWEKDLNQPWENHKMHYDTLRDLYKSIETYVSYRYPELEKSLNASSTMEAQLLESCERYKAEIIELKQNLANNANASLLASPSTTANGMMAPVSGST